MLAVARLVPRDYLQVSPRREADMIDQARAFRTTLGVARNRRPDLPPRAHERPRRQASEYSWIPGSVLDGDRIQPVRRRSVRECRWPALRAAVGFAILDVDRNSSPTIVVFARASDTRNARVAWSRRDESSNRSRQKTSSVSAGPIPAADRRRNKAGLRALPADFDHDVAPLA
jgi:hypothetical protein